MIAKLKIKSTIHPALDAVCEKYKLTLQNLFSHEGANELMKKVECVSQECEDALRYCSDILEFYLESETSDTPL